MCMAEVAQSEKGESNSELALRCDGCGTHVDKLYQRNLCKPCLVRSFRGVVEVIDYYRAGGGGPAPAP
jgi:rRNA maturation endonuclease Nob1